MNKFFKKSDKDLYETVKKKLPSQKEQMKVYQKHLDEILKIIEEGKEEYKHGIMTEFEYAAFIRDSKKLMYDIKEDIKAFKEHINIIEDFIYLYEEYSLRINE